MTDWTREEELQRLGRVLRMAQSLLSLIIVEAGQEQAELLRLQGVAELCPLEGAEGRGVDILVGDLTMAPYLNLKCDQLGAQRTLIVVSAATLAALAWAAPDFMNRTSKFWLVAPPDESFPPGG